MDMDRNPDGGSGTWQMTTATWVQIVVIASLSVIIITVNALTIVVLQRTSTLRSLSNLYVKSLATVDLTVGVSILPTISFFIPYIGENYVHRYPRVCLFIISSVTANVLMSVVHLMVIAVDRCICITAPFFYYEQFTRGRALAVIFAVWLFGALYVCVSQVVLPAVERVDKCTVDSVLPAWLGIYLNSAIYLTTVLVTVAMYAVILYKAAAHRKAIESVVPRETGQWSGTFELADVVIEETDGVDKPMDSFITLGESMNDFTSPEELAARRKVRQSVNYETRVSFADRKRRTASIKNESSDFGSVRAPFPFRPSKSALRNVKFFTTVFGVYFLCITPASVSIVLDYFLEVPPLLYESLNMLAISNSAANFFILYSLNAVFRKALKDTFFHAECCEPSTSNAIF